ncbi:MAG: phytoene/squalene synthase family protein [Planctomycetota bacterium]|nr:MAG: phytoene/squalene synthase family protein [Planctomycetota bacterium]
MNKGLQASYDHCQEIARRSASSFYYSFLLLPEEKRAAMCALYAFLRRTDDLGDSSDSQASRREALSEWRKALARSLAGRFDDPLLPALADTVRLFDVPPEHLEAVIEGVEMDLDPREYETFDQLEEYCHRVASAVGLACLPIWGYSGDEAEQPARKCGLAFQLTNILRDLKEDLARNRVYLPREDFERFDYSAALLRSGVRDERFGRLMQYQIERAEQLYAEGAELVHHLSADGRRIFGGMMTVYQALLERIKHLGGDVFSTRVELSRWQKMRLASQWFLGRTPLASPAGASAR